MTFFVLFIGILSATFVVGFLLALRHPRKRWNIAGRVFLASSISFFLAYLTWSEVPLEIFVYASVFGGFAWQEIIYTYIIARFRKKRFPHEDITAEDADATALV